MSCYGSQACHRLFPVNPGYSRLRSPETGWAQTAKVGMQVGTEIHQSDLCFNYKLMGKANGGG